MRWHTNFINNVHRKKNKETNKSKGNDKSKWYNGSSRRNSRNNSSFTQTSSRNNNNSQSNKNKGNGYLTMMTAPSMGQFISGANVTKINMVTILGPVVLPIAIQHTFHQTPITRQEGGTKQHLHLKYTFSPETPSGFLKSGIIPE